MSPDPDRTHDAPVARRPEKSGEPADLAALALLLRDQERRALLEPEGPAGAAIAAEAAAMRTLLEEAAAGAIAQGRSLAAISASTMPSSDPRARFEAMGRLAAACARLAEVENVLIEEARALGGEMPVGRNAQFQRAMSQTRFHVHVAVRLAVLRGVAPHEVLGVTRTAGLDLEEGDLSLAFEL